MFCWIILQFTQEVSKKLLGNSADGVGRLNMMGKTCEVKAAQPKDATQGSQNHQRGRRSGGGMRGFRGPNNGPVNGMPVPPPFPYQAHHNYPFMDPMASYPPQDVPPVMGAPAGPYAGYPPVPGYVAPMYFPTNMAPPANVPTFPMAPGHQPYMMEHAYATPPPAGPMNVGQPVAIPPVLPADPMQVHPQAFAFIPVMAASGVPPPGQPSTAPPQQASVMQPVAPGLPIKPEEASPNDNVSS